MSRDLAAPGRMLLAALTLTAALPAVAATRALAVGGFAFEIDVVVAGAPEQVFDAFTGKTIEWWDHSFSAKPLRMYFEPRPGGGFYEIFDEQGHGVRHAEVTWAERGKRLRFIGPLGLAGNAIDLVHTLDFEPVEQGTRLRLSVQATGAVQDGWPETVERVWRHFLEERFRSYLAGRVGSQ